MDVDEGDDAAVRVAARHDGKDGEKQDVRQLIKLALPTPGIGDLRQQPQQWRKCSHGNLQVGCHPRSQTKADSGIRFLSSPSTSLRWCCSPDSLTLPVSVEQPWVTWQ